MFKLTILGIVIAVVGVLYYNSRNQIVPGPIVLTKNGPVQGKVSKTRDGKNMYEYSSIPYAKPPIGDLRYEPPQSLESTWTEVRDATKPASSCVQINFLLNIKMGHEDCLYLNIFTPSTNPDSMGKLRPTFVWLHGGAFLFGSADMYRGNYLVDEDVVLVTIGYRLASLGFLNTGDNVVNGNMGLKDQTMALRWIKENIANFGGDPNNVVLAGESAGSACVHYHLLSSMSKGLFAKAIALSGVAISSWAIKINSTEQAKRYGKNVGCPTETSQEMIDCLKRASPEQLLEGHKEIMENLKHPDAFFAPTIETTKDDNTFVVEHPMDSLRKGRFDGIPVILGYNSHEGLLNAPRIVRDDILLEKFNQDFNKNMANFLMIPNNDREKINNTLTKARDFYFGNGEPVNSSKKFENYTNIATDYLFANDLYKTANVLHSQVSPVYLYYYKFKGQFTLTNILLAIKGKYPLPVEFFIFKVKNWFRQTILGEDDLHYGACHGDELALLFKMEGIYDVGTSHVDYEMSKKLVKLWATFARGGQPMKFRGVEWEPIQKNKELKYIILDTESKMVTQPHKDRINFWNTIQSST